MTELFDRNAPWDCDANDFLQQSSCSVKENTRVQEVLKGFLLGEVWRMDKSDLKTVIRACGVDTKQWREFDTALHSIFTWEPPMGNVAEDDWPTCKVIDVVPENRREMMGIAVDLAQLSARDFYTKGQDRLDVYKIGRSASASPRTMLAACLLYELYANGEIPEDQTMFWSSKVQNLLRMNIGIIGNGFVGHATKLLSKSDTVNKVLVYDIIPDKCDPVGTLLDDLVQKCQVIFICVPTPTNLDTGKCHTGIVVDLVKTLNVLSEKYSKAIEVVVRSTVPPGTSDSLGVHFMPEFLTEKNWERDFTNNKDWILGTLNNSESDITDLICKIAHGFNPDIRVHFTNNKTAELAKYTRNAFLATKVSFFNEINEYCNKMGIHYSDIRDFVVLDSRINESHTQVPGPDGKYGYGGVCIPKDIIALNHEFKKKGCNPYIINAVITRNESIDRPEGDWKSVGRSSFLDN